MAAQATRIKTSLGQHQTMTPQLLQSIRLLQLTQAELLQEINQALAGNLLLEAVEPSEDSTDGESEALHDATDGERRAEAESLTAEVSGCDEAATARVEADFDWSSQESWSSGEPVGEEGEHWSARVADRETGDVRIAVLRQLALVVSDPQQARMVSAIVDEVDDNGYLQRGLDELAASTEHGIDAPLAEWERALGIVQSAEPTGFGARDLRECLLLQLDALPRVTRGLRLARRIVDEALTEYASLSEAEAMAYFDVTAATLANARALIRTLDPKPAASFTVATEAVIPDVIVSGRDGQWRVELNRETLPRVRINRAYERSITDGAGAHRALKEQLSEARWLVRGLEMRHETLLRTAQNLFQRQARFLVAGEEGMAPLNMKEVADAIGMHESTVCRVVANKYVATPWGVYPMKAFFPVQIAGRDGDVSGTAVRAMLRRLIDSERSEAPYSDGDLVALLARQGITLARRTVAKYRDTMGIPAVAQRQTVDRVSAAA